MTLWSPSTWEASGLGALLLLHSAQPQPHPHPHAHRSVNPPAPSRELPVGPYLNTVGPTALVDLLRSSSSRFPSQIFGSGMDLLGAPMSEFQMGSQSQWSRASCLYLCLLPHRTGRYLSKSFGGPVHCRMHDGRELSSWEKVLQVRLWALLCPTGSEAPAGHEP